jgi:hypothetical protein
MAMEGLELGNRAVVWTVVKLNLALLLLGEVGALTAKQLLLQLGVELRVLDRSLAVNLLRRV